MRNARIEPSLSDDSGYHITHEDLSFLRISADSLAAFRDRLTPLGCEPAEWEHFIELLKDALAKDGVTKADVRLQGSAANFFSGQHKKMPYEVDAFLKEFLADRGRIPTRLEVDRVVDTLARIWPDESDRPLRRPFDVLFHLRIARYPSDLDVQVSSAQIFAKVTDYLQDAGIPPGAMMENTPYRFIRKEHVKVVCPHLTNWALVQSDVIRRPVTVAVFDECGPPVRSKPPSSHHRENDWRILNLEHGDDTYRRAESNDRSLASPTAARA